MSVPLIATFRAKVQEMSYGDTVRKYVQVPTLKRSHVDMNIARQHERFGAYANSDMFVSMLSNCAAVKPGKIVYLDNIPAGVTVDTSEFLATVMIEVTR